MDAFYSCRRIFSHPVGLQCEWLLRIVGCAAAGAGALELHGIGQISLRRFARRRLVGPDQLILLAVILFYVGLAHHHVDFEPYRSRLLPLMQTPLFKMRWRRCT